VVNWLAALAAVFLAFVAHEAGHTTAGLLMGFRFGAFAAGPFCFARTEHGSGYDHERLDELRRRVDQPD
jgi:hypothetical protein